MFLLKTPQKAKHTHVLTLGAHSQCEKSGILLTQTYFCIFLCFKDKILFDQQFHILKLIMHMCVRSNLDNKSVTSRAIVSGQPMANYGFCHFHC